MALSDEIRAVLEQAASGRGAHPHFISAYQILARLEPASRAQLIKDHGPVGKGVGSNRSAATAIADEIKHRIQTW